MRWRSIMALGMLLAVGAVGNRAEARVYIPGVKIIFEVRTPQGDLRSYQRPGLPPYLLGSSLSRRARAIGCRLMRWWPPAGPSWKKCTSRWTARNVAALTKAPWRTEVDTTNLALGEHPIEVKASTASPHSRTTAAKATLVVAAADERAEHAVVLPASDTDRERLSSVVGCVDPELDRALDDRAAAVVSKPQLFFASAGPGAKEFFYTLSREGQVVYTSPLLPMVTYVYLEPAPKLAAAAPKPTSPSLLTAGEVILSIQVGDGAGRFGPPVGVTLQIQPEEVKP